MLFGIPIFSGTGSAARPRGAGTATAIKKTATTNTCTRPTKHPFVRSSKF